MSNTNQYEWVKFYKELAQKLQEYKNDRLKLITIFDSIYVNNKPSFIRDKNTDIDPFTAFALFNIKNVNAERRHELCVKIKEQFNLQASAPMPEEFAGIDVIEARSTEFFSNNNEIDSLWDFFEAALNYANNNKDKKRVVECFNSAIGIKGNTINKITKGLHWIAPDFYLNLAYRSEWYIFGVSGSKKNTKPVPKEHKFIPDNIVKDEYKGRIYNQHIPAEIYFEISDKLRNFLSGAENSSGIDDFAKLSSKAIEVSEIVNGRNNDKTSENPSSKLSAAVIANNGKEQYNKAEFLKEVYMTSDKYDTLAGLLKYKKNVILQGAPGVGKTFAAKRLAFSMMGEKDENRVVMVQFHQSYSYEDFIEGYRPVENGFTLESGIFRTFCSNAADDKDNDYYFIIDEINRGNLSKIFGELFMLIESDKRGQKLKLLYSKEDFWVPENVRIIGLMNTADRSLAMLDYALRRRFAFFEMEPGFDTEQFKKYQRELNNAKFNALTDLVKEVPKKGDKEHLNNVISDDLGKGFRIGHSFFCGLKADDDIDSALMRIVMYELIPLIDEYWFDEKDKLMAWIEKLENAIR